MLSHSQKLSEQYEQGDCIRLHDPRPLTLSSHSKMFFELRRVEQLVRNPRNNILPCVQDIYTSTKQQSSKYFI